MVESSIEAMLASPPERDELVVQLFVRNGGQWGEIYRDNGEYWIDLYLAQSESLRFRLDQFIESLDRSSSALHERLGGTVSGEETKVSEETKGGATKVSGTVE